MVTFVGADIGGSLCKLAMQTSDAGTRAMLKRLGWKSATARSGGMVLLATVPTSRENIEEIFGAIRKMGSVRVAVTGGGIHKHIDVIRTLASAPNITLCQKNDEFKTLSLGLLFARSGLASRPLYQLTDFFFHGEVGPDRARVTTRHISISPSTPMLVVNIGTGTSIVDIAGDASYLRLGGSSLGGGTFLGLCKALTKCRDFDEAVALAASGNSRNVDLVVGDIYGEEDEQLGSKYGLRSSTLASSFAKLAGGTDSTDADKALSTLIMVTMNVAALAHLHARLHGRKLILFTGTFLYKNPVALRTLAYAIDFWSKGARAAVFVQHASYLGCFGALSSLLPSEDSAPQSHRKRDGRHARAADSSNLFRTTPALVMSTPNNRAKL
ncbi:Pantothenate kinase 2 [Diplonema papillatum]|nr:Pantothenate kinase 2 [Diplonema papillatum]